MLADNCVERTAAQDTGTGAAIGALAGAAIGAGAGAIIGSPGAGAAVGTVTGGTAGVASGVARQTSARSTKQFVNRSLSEREYAVLGWQ